MRKNKLLLLLALLMTAVTGAWAQSTPTEVSTFADLQTALSAGNDVKLTANIQFTSAIEISGSKKITIDGNGKTLSTTSEIRAFKVGASATVAFKNLTLTGFVNEGGPAINNKGTIVLDGCTISNCHVSNGDGGGAIENKSSGKLYAINTTFSGNYSGEIGGAINNYRGSLYMSGCTFTDNYTTSSDAYYGGAIGINSGDEVRLINCSFSGNKYGTATGLSDIGVFFKPDNYTIAGCTGVTIASGDGNITTIATGTATLDYSDLSNITFTYTPVAPEYYNKLTIINDDYNEQKTLLKQLYRGYPAYNSSLTAAQAYALATYQAAIDGKPVYVIMSVQGGGYEIHYALSTDAAATEHTTDFYEICDPINPVRMYYVAQ